MLLTGCRRQGVDLYIEESGVPQLRCNRHGVIVTLRISEYFNWGLNNRVEMVTFRSSECFNLGAEDNLEMVTMRRLKCLTVFQKRGCRLYIEESGVFSLGCRRQGGVGYIEESRVP